MGLSATIPRRSRTPQRFRFSHNGKRNFSVEHVKANSGKANARTTRHGANLLSRPANALRCVPFFLHSRSGPLEFQLPTEMLRSDETVMNRDIRVDEPMTDDDFRQLERQNLMAVLTKTNWKVSGIGGAAELLGVNPATLRSRMRTMNVRRPR